MENTTKLHLPADRLHAVTVEGNWRLSCSEGSLLATLSGCPEDFCLRAGESLVLPGGGLLLVEALGAPAHFVLQRPPAQKGAMSLFTSWRRSPRTVFG